MRIMNTKTWLQERADWDWEMGWNKRHIVNFGTRGSRGGSPVYDSMIFEHSGLFHIIITVFSPLLEATRAQELTLSALRTSPYGLHSNGSLPWSSYGMLDPTWPRSGVTSEFSLAVSCMNSKYQGCVSLAFCSGATESFILGKTWAFTWKSTVTTCWELFCSLLSWLKSIQPQW